MSIISMIERCFGRASRGECATCESKANCVVAKWQRGFPDRQSPPDRRGGVAPERVRPFVALLRDLARTVERGLAPAVPSFRERVEAKVEALLPGDVGVDRVAGALGVSRQTLYRRLKAEGTTFEQLLDHMRRKLAMRYVRSEGLGVKQTAYRLGFSDPASFSRAFKRWTGVSPSAFRSAP